MLRPRRVRVVRNHSIPATISEKITGTGMPSGVAAKKFTKSNEKPYVVIGGLIIGTINNGLNILQVQTYYQLVVMGGLIIAAVALDRLISK